MLVTFILDELRDRWGIVRITSGLRSKGRNKAVGGVNRSQHTLGEAVDFVCPGADMLEVYYWMIENQRWPGETIYYQKKGHIHVSLPRYSIKIDQFINREE